MTRRLIVMRHAKSSWDSDAHNDHARPLNKRGRRDAPAIARRGVLSLLRRPGLLGRLRDGDLVRRIHVRAGR